MIITLDIGWIDEENRPVLESSDQIILTVEGLKTYFFTESGTVKAVDGVDFTIGKGEILGWSVNPAVAKV